ncbi:glyoxalase/bleomycin resistance/dioxygenase family protein [Persephonella atlantica]|uniref:Glyoxalase/bleomycin resistance/dioxygenase family protein n=1 Tax=Persephonella atlantica TaxID=2699429 RepID=A0ABS1GFC2_9AQUI|nr:VOC family protein [Persephonella atlantica]MBK3331614.1 glyoxalase/bleomycin resistance/dioxygenase family protein [Persephonella atlantica]
MDFAVHHVALSVSDIRKSERFYGFFGFRKVAEYISESEGLHILHLKKDSFIIELFSFRDYIPSEKYSLWEDLKVLGYRHIAFKVEDIYRAKEELIKKGLISPSTEIKKGKTGILYFFLTDPDGNFVEIVEDKRDI